MRPETSFKDNHYDTSIVSKALQKDMLLSTPQSERSTPQSGCGFRQGVGSVRARVLSGRAFLCLYLRVTRVVGMPN